MELSSRRLRRLRKALVAGEMGIGNTSSATAMLAALTGRPASDLTGRGAGLSDIGLQRKIQVLTDALAAREVDRYNAFDVLRKVGGLDIAAMVGFYAGAAMTGTPVILDGLISLVAALTLVRLVPETRYVMFPSHLPAEKGGETALRELGIGLSQAKHETRGRAGALMFLPLLDLARFLISNHRRSMKVASRPRSIRSVVVTLYRWLAERQVGTCRTIRSDEAQGSLALRGDTATQW